MADIAKAGKNGVVSLINTAVKATNSKMSNWGNQPPRLRRNKRNGKGGPKRKQRGKKLNPFAPEFMPRGGSFIQAPSFTSTNVVTAPSSEVVKKTEFLMDVPLYGTTYVQHTGTDPGFYVTSFSLNPVETGTFSILPGIAENYQQMMMNGITLTFEAGQGASQQGRGVAYVQTDPTRPEPISIYEAEQADRAQKFGFITGTSVRFGPECFNVTPPVKQVKEPDNPDPASDDPLITAGRLVICTAGSTVAGMAAVIVGRFVITYTCSLAKQIDGSNASIKTGLTIWPTTTLDDLRLSSGTTADHIHQPLVDTPDLRWGSTGYWMRIRNPRRAHVIHMQATNNGVWADVQLRVLISPTGNTLINDATNATRIDNHCVNAGLGIRLFFIPRYTKFVALQADPAHITNISVLTYEVRASPTFL